MAELLFYNEYEQFYKMANESKAFRSFCKEAYGEDFSQDGFSDINQINTILKYIPHKKDTSILDVGCGNGKMLGYLQEKTNAFIYGFDYSINAINEAKSLYPNNSEFKCGCIGEIDYPKYSFDLIILMDSIYFAPDLSSFIDQMMEWLKTDGKIFVAYQEGDVIPKTENINTTILGKTLKDKGISFMMEDITRESYDMLLKKREVALKYEKMFIKEGNEEWYNLLIWQTDYANVSFEEFSKKMARYIFIIDHKGN